MKQLDSALMRRLVESIYCAAVMPDHWATTTGQLGQAFRSHYSTLYAVDPARGRVLYFHSNDTEPEVAQTWQTHYAHQDMRIDAILHRPAGLILTNDRVIERHRFARTAIYNEFLVPTDSEECLAVVPLKSEGARVIMSMNRGGRIGPYSDPECRFFSALTPHLQRATLISTELHRSEHSQHLSREMMNRMSFGVVFLGQGGKVLDLNERAHSLLSPQGPLYVQKGNLLAADPAANRALQRAIAAAVSPSPTTHPYTGRIAVPRQDSAPPLRLTVTPLPRSAAAFALHFSVAAVFIFSDGDAPRLDAQVLRALFDLTAAEALLAQRLVAGGSLKDIATQAGLSLHTVRTHLKRLLAKTQCANQASLVRTLLLSPATEHGAAKY